MPVPSLTPRAPTPSTGDPIAELRAALEGFDEGTAHKAIDHIMERFAIESVVTNVIFPYLRDLGDRWDAGEITVAQEHFASRVLRSRLIGRGRGWDDGAGPRAVLACAPHELHDLPLVCLALALREQGWRITLLGADTPIDTVMTTTDVLHQDLTVLSFMIGTAVDESRDALAELARRTAAGARGPGMLAARSPPRSARSMSTATRSRSRAASRSSARWSRRPASGRGRHRRPAAPGGLGAAPRACRPPTATPSPISARHQRSGQDADQRDVELRRARERERRR